jgi:hypothetical protein
MRSAALRSKVPEHEIKLFTTFPIHTYAVPRDAQPGKVWQSQPRHPDYDEKLITDFFLV